MNTYTIRPEQASDQAAIRELTVEAFASLEISKHNEQLIIDALRAQNSLTLSLVAELDNQVIGHIAFSPVTISDGTPDWYGLGPVSVLPPLQSKGIGKALIHKGLMEVKKLGAAGCCLVGHPEYYKQFGFANSIDLELPGVPAEVFFTLAFKNSRPRGTVAFHEAFTVDYSDKS